MRKIVEKVKNCQNFGFSMRKFVKKESKFVKIVVFQWENLSNKSQNFGFQWENLSEKSIFCQNFGFSVRKIVKKVKICQSFGFSSAKFVTFF